MTKKRLRLLTNDILWNWNKYVFLFVSHSNPKVKKETGAEIFIKGTRNCKIEIILTV